MRRDSKKNKLICEMVLSLMEKNKGRMRERVSGLELVVVVILTKLGEASLKR